MNTTEKISMLLRPITLAIILIGLEALALFSCQKDNNVNSDDIEEVSDTPDEKNDLVAFLDPLAGILWADPEYVETALSLLDAIPVGNNTFVKQGMTPDGRPVPIRFTLQPRNASEIYFQAEVVDNTSTGPDLVNSFEVKGTMYKVYKNAECGKGGPGFTSGCDNLGDGTSRHNVWNAWPFPTCKKGSGFCVEVYAVAGVEVTYVNHNCQGLVKSTRDMLAYQCQ